MRGVIFPEPGKIFANFFCKNTGCVFPLANSISEPPLLVACGSLSLFLSKGNALEAVLPDPIQSIPDLLF